MLHLGELDHVDKQAGKRREHVALRIVSLKRENAVSRKRDPIEPHAVLVIGVCFCVQPLRFFEVNAVFLPVKQRFSGSSWRGFCPLNALEERLHIRRKQITVLPPVRPLPEEVHEVERDRVLCLVVESDDLAPIRRELLHKGVFDLVVRLVSAHADDVEHLAFLKHLPRDLVSLVRNTHGAGQLFHKPPFAPEIIFLRRHVAGIFRRGVVVVSQKVLVGRANVKQRIGLKFKRVFHGTERLLVALRRFEHLSHVLLRVGSWACGNPLDAVVLDRRVRRVHFTEAERGSECGDHVLRGQASVFLRKLSVLGKQLRISTETRLLEFRREVRVRHAPHSPFVSPPQAPVPRRSCGCSNSIKSFFRFAWLPPQ